MCTLRGLATWERVKVDVIEEIRQMAFQQPRRFWLWDGLGAFYGGLSARRKGQRCAALTQTLNVKLLQSPHAIVVGGERPSWAEAAWWGGTGRRGIITLFCYGLTDLGIALNYKLPRDAVRFKISATHEGRFKWEKLMYGCVLSLRC